MGVGFIVPYNVQKNNSNNLYLLIFMILIVGITLQLKSKLLENLLIFFLFLLLF